MKRLVFTFGTLYGDDIVGALLGAVPDNFYATLPAYAIYKAGFEKLSPKVQEQIIASKNNPTTFKFVFVKPDREQSVQGRAYYIDASQELVLDHWEIYPDWYRKAPVVIRAADTTQHEAFIYTVDHDGEKLTEFKRVLSDPETVLASARATRARVISKFPAAFA